MSSWSVHQGTADNFTIFSDLADIGTVSVAPGDQSSTMQPQWRFTPSSTLGHCGYSFLLLHPKDYLCPAQPQWRWPSRSSLQ